MKLPAETLRTDALYPTWLLPEPLRLQVAGNSPVYQGKLMRVAGPQRMEATSWLMAGEGKATADEDRVHPPAMRDYFIYRTGQGSLLWIYSERLERPTPEHRARRTWYLQGFFA